MKRILLSTLAIGILLLSACGTSTTPPTTTTTPPAMPTIPPTTTTATTTPTTTTAPPTETITVTAPASISEPPLIEDGWIRLNIKDVGSIEYPIDFLELQSGDYELVMEVFAQIWELPIADFTLQQVGLNELKPSAFEEYRRVIFLTDYLNPGEEVFKTNEKYTLSRLELLALQYVYTEQLRQELASMGIKLVGVVAVEVMEVNGMFPLVYTFTRQLNDNPVVLVQTYIFPNYDREHYLTLSYRVEDEEESRDIYDKILDSFRLQ